MKISYSRFHHSVLMGFWACVCAMVVFVVTVPAGATEAVVPWECTGFGGEAQDRCMRTLAELQQEKIAKLEKDLQVQQQTVQQLQQQVSQQASATAELQRQYTQNPSRWYGSSFEYGYPPLGLNLRFGRDRFIGGSIFYGPSRYFGSRFYGHGHQRWHRH